MIAREQALPIQGFKGLDKSSPFTVPGLTRSLLNVEVREGRVIGRGGVDFDSTFSAVMSENIQALMPYVATSGAVTLLRIGPTKVESSTGGAWSDITGTALTGAATDIPQWAMFRDVLYFTNYGQDRMRYWNGSGNTTEIATGPWARGILSYYGFLFALYVSEDGTTFEPRRALYSEDPQNDWTLCEGNELNFHETQGAITTGAVFGRTALVLKEDGVVYLRWIGGPVRFSQELAKGAPGTLAPLGGQSIGEKGYLYLGTDYQLWIATANDIIPMPPKVNDILRNDLYRTNVKYCRSCLNEEKNIYSLFFPLDSTGNKGRIVLNYNTGEFSYSQYDSHGWDAMEAFRWAYTSPVSMVGAVDTAVYTLDVNTVKADETSASAETAVSRYYDTDWLQYANMNEGRVMQAAAQFTGAGLVFDSSNYAKVAISVALDHKNEFRFRKVYDLRKKHVDDEYTTVRYDLPPVQCEWVNLRIELFPSVTENPVLRAGWLYFIPQPEKRDINRGGSISES